MMTQEYSEPLKAALLCNSRESKLKAATDWLAHRWVLHPNNRVKKLAEPLPEVFSWKPRVLKGARK